MTRLLMCLAMSWTIVLGSLVEKSSDAEQHDTIPKSTEAFKADLDKRGKRTLVIGEGHATQVNGCCVLVQVGEAWGNLDLPTPAYENHTNLDAVTIDADQSNPDYRGCFRSNTPLPNAYFDRVIDARAIFNKGVILERDVQKLMDTNEGELRLIYNALNPSGVFEFQYDASFDVRGLGDRMSRPPNHLKFGIDVMCWTGPTRVWLKWWANPRAWWDPSRYELGSSVKVEWDETQRKTVVNVPKEKDLDFIASQVMLYVWHYWGFYKYTPYILPETRKVLDQAAQMRFDKVEKPRLEAFGFTDVRMEIWKNPRTHRQERVIFAQKPQE